MYLSVAFTIERNLRHPVTLARASVCSGVMDNPFFFPPFFLAAATVAEAQGVSKTHELHFSRCGIRIEP